METLIIIATFFSVLFAVLIGYYIQTASTRWILLFVVPYFICHMTYWYPVYFQGASQSEFSSWQLIVIFPMYVIALLLSIISAKLTQYFKNKHK
jgi:Fe2+ transport system protein B